MDIDKIPLKEFKEDPINETYSLGTLMITKEQAALCQKINQILDFLITLEERVSKIEGK